MTTGALAIQESLQLEGMAGRREIPSGKDVPISVLNGPTIKSHPFKELLQGRTPIVFPIADLVPYDNYYCHFSSISKEIAASDLFKQWGGSLLRAMTVSARDSDLPSRYMNQLCVDLSGLTRLFGGLVIGEIAITGGDPFMREGTDVAMIIHVKSRRVFDAMTSGYANGILKANQDAQASESKYEGVSIRRIATPDRLRPIMRIGWHERMRNACLKNIEPIRALFECNNATEKTLNEVSRQIEGVTLRCPCGGIYRYDSQRNIVYCSVHGNRNYPRQPGQMTENEGLLDFIGRMIDFSVEFKFTEEGIMTKLAFDLEPEVDTPTVFTCSMHPQIKTRKTGKCSICGMDLVLATPER